MSFRAGLAALVLVASAGCSDPVGRGEPTAPAVVTVDADPTLAGQVPAGLRIDGGLRIGTDPAYQPFQFRDSQNRLTGVEVQLLMAVAALLDLTPVFIAEAYSAVDNGVLAGRLDIGASAVTLSPEQSLATDAVRYLDTSLRLARPTGSALTLEGLCGSRIAVREGSPVLSLLDTATEQCRASGQPPVAAVARFTQVDLTRALLTGQADGLLADAPVVVSAVNSHPTELEAAPGESSPATLVLLTPPRGTLAPLVAAAIDSLIASGEYVTILRSFGVTTGGVAAAEVIPAGTALADPLDAAPG